MIEAILSAIWHVLTVTWDFLLLLAPFLLLGFLVAGLLHVLIPGAFVQRVMGGRGLKSAANAGAIGLGLPVCSCGVVPVSIALRDKGASRPAISSFLITTPETGVDSIFVTWVLLGPIVTAWRVVSSFFSALLAAVMTIAFADDDDPPRARKAAQEQDHHHGHDHDHDHGQADKFGEEIGPRVLGRSIKISVVNGWRRFNNWLPLGDWYRPEVSREKEAAIAVLDKDGTVSFSDVVKRIFLYAFRDVTDDVLPALVVGVLLGGIIAALAPSDLADYGLGHGVLPYLVMFTIGIPIYMCSSASTPIGAALILKGVAPGAVLVFLLTGPATNLATLLMIRARFGTAFMATYLGGIVLGALIAGIALDLAIAELGVQIEATIGIQDVGVPIWLMWASALFLIGIAAWRIRVGAFQQGLADTFSNVHGLFLRMGGTGAEGGRLRDLFGPRSRLTYICVAVLAVLYIGSGLYVVPPGNLGFTQIFGKVVARDLVPGLHYAPPWPFGKDNVWHVKQPRVIYLGVQTNVDNAAENVAMADTGTTNPNDLAADASEEMGDRPDDLSTEAGSSESDVATPSVETKTGKAEYITGDGNLVQMVLSVQYDITDAYSYFFLAEDPEKTVAHLAEMAARSFAATYPIDPLLRNQRHEFAADVKELLQALIDHRHVHDADAEGTVHTSPERASEILADMGIEQDLLNRSPLGVRVIAVNLVDIHPTSETMAAFRDVASAHEDRDTFIRKAERVLQETIPRARGNAIVEVERAEAEADSRRLRGEGRARRWIDISEAVETAPEVLRDLLWYEANERALAGREKVVLPPGAESGELIFWRGRTAREAPTSLHPHKGSSP